MLNEQLMLATEEAQRQTALLEAEKMKNRQINDALWEAQEQIRSLQISVAAQATAVQDAQKAFQMTLQQRLEATKKDHQAIFEAKSPKIRELEMQLEVKLKENSGLKETVDRYRTKESDAISQVLKETEGEGGGPPVKYSVRRRRWRA